VLPNGDHAGASHATLAAAVEGARSGDTIEICGDGPFTTGPVEIKGKALCIRAGDGATGNIQGEIKFAGGDPSKSVLACKTADFRLAKDSAGKGKGKDGKDLGADVDKVGPGKAYHEWRKTKEYAELHRKTEELLAGKP